MRLYCSWSGPAFRIEAPGCVARVGLVRVRRNGRHRFYRTNAVAIRPLHEWTETFERYWQHQLFA